MAKWNTQYSLCVGQNWWLENSHKQITHHKLEHGSLWQQNKSDSHQVMWNGRNYDLAIQVGCWIRRGLLSRQGREEKLYHASNDTTLIRVTESFSNFTRNLRTTHIIWTQHFSFSESGGTCSVNVLRQIKSSGTKASLIPLTWVHHMPNLFHRGESSPSVHLWTTITHPKPMRLSQLHVHCYRKYTRVTDISGHFRLSHERHILSKLVTMTALVN